MVLAGMTGQGIALDGNSGFYLSHYLCELRLCTLLLPYRDVDGRSRFGPITALALDNELIVGTLGGLSFAYCRRRAEGELITGAGGVEDGLFCFGHRLLGGILRQFLHSALLKSPLLQETVKFLWCSSHSCSAYTVSRLYGSLGQSLDKGISRGVQTTAAKGAEGHNGLSCEVIVSDEGGDRCGISAEPDGIAEEDNVVVGEFRLQGFQCRQLATLHLPLTALHGFPKVTGIGCNSLDTFDVGL